VELHGLRLGAEFDSAFGPRFCYAVGSEIGPKLKAVLGSELGTVL
jgi:hypothetical protein